MLSWGLMESLIDGFIEELLHLDDSPNEIGDVIVGNMEIRGKISTLKGLSAIRQKSYRHFAPDWLDTMIKILDYIDGDLRPSRNLVVHAEWFTLGRKSPTLVTKKTKILRPQAFIRILETRQSKLMRLTQVRAISHRILEAQFDLFHLFCYAMRPYPPDVGEDGKPMPILTLRRYLRAVGHTLRVVKIAPEKKRTKPHRPKKPPPKS